MFERSDAGALVNARRKHGYLHEIFREAADTLFASVKSTMGNQPTDVLQQLVQQVSGQRLIPALFLYRHAFELQLKATLNLLDELEGIPSRIHRGHSLRNLWSRIAIRLKTHLADDQQETLLRPLDRRLEYLQSNIDAFDVVDPDGTTFRYEENSTKHAPPTFEILVFEQHCRQSSAILEKIICALGTFLDAKEERA